MNQRRQAEPLLVAAAKFTHVLDLRRELDSTDSARDLGLDYLRFPVADDGAPKPAEWFQAGIDYVAQAVTDPAARVLVCCVAGVNRAPSMTYAILRSRGASRFLAWAQVVRARPAAGRNGIRYSQDYEQTISEQETEAASRSSA